MNSEEFKSYWNAKFEETHPIGHQLKDKLKNRWFRIHSLPESKRYAESEEEYKTIFHRQNTLIEDLLEGDENVILLFGLYKDKIDDQELEISYFGEFEEFFTFEKVDTLEIHKINPNEEFELYCDIYLKNTIWIRDQRNEILKFIADDKLNMMIILPSKHRILYPYDGGMDIILESSEKKDFYKKKYCKWLSKFPSGL